jgi:hypothetical protein
VVSAVTLLGALPALVAALSGSPGDDRCALQ